MLDKHMAGTTVMRRGILTARACLEHLQVLRTLYRKESTAVRSQAYALHLMAYCCVARLRRNRAALVSRMASL